MPDRVSSARELTEVGAADVIADMQRHHRKVHDQSYGS
jgi:hypothetical protein